LHEQLFVADLHADPLLWNRKLLKRHSYGHVDLPRMIDGNVALQVCAAVTRMPWGTNIELTVNNSDGITALIASRGWPPRTWTSLLQRTLYQADNLKRCVAQSKGCLVLVKNIRELDELVAQREASPQRTPVGAMLALEGAHALEGDLDNLDLLYDAGFRIIGLAHFFDNQAGGSAHGVEKGGLTAFGRELVQCVQEKGMLIDLAHASPRVIDDVLEMASAPVIVSHTGLRGTCDNTRNISDEHVRAIAANGGVMGIGMFKIAVCGTRIEDTARAIRYGADLVGPDHFASGSDFDGAIAASIDASGLALLTEALIGQGFTREEIARIMGQNVLRVLRQVLPP
jgi:microsomal dipeptidase-like Zn-dependent dipeptidase